MAVEVLIVTYRDIFQSEALERDRFGEDYQKRSAFLKLDEKDMLRLGVKDGGKVRLKNGSGSVVVLARRSEEDSPHAGMAFMPNSPWSNQLISEEIGDSRIPEFKKITATVSPTDEDLTSINDILKTFA
jgi:formylmethanofuran dehydrogenase subunit D